MVGIQRFIQLVFLVAFIVFSDALQALYHLHNGRLSHESKVRSLATPNTSPPALSSTSTTTIEETLVDYLRRNDTTTPITVEGYVTSKRTLGKQLVFVDFEIAKNDICQAMLRQEYFSGDHYEGYKRCLLKGCKFKVTGTALPTRNPGNVVLLIQSLRLTGLPRQLQHLQIVLTQGQEGSVPLEEVASASHMEVSVLKMEFDKITECTSAGSGPTKPEAKGLWKALSKYIYNNLPKDPLYPEAADQAKVSKKGTYVLPQYPSEWNRVPDLRSSSEEVQEPGSVAKTLLLPRDSSSPRTISVEGWVQNRRRFDGNITQFSLVDNVTMTLQKYLSTNGTSSNRLKCLIHPDLLEQTVASVYNSLLSVGARVWVTGQLILTNDSEENEAKSPFLLLVQDIHLLQSSSRSATIRHLLDLMAADAIDLEEAANALNLPFQEALELQQNSNPTERQWKANQLAVQLQQNKRQVVNPLLLETMEKYRPLLEKNPPAMIELHEPVPSVQESLKNKQTNHYSQAIPLSMPGSRWMSRKKPQLEWMGQRIQSVLQSHPDYGKRPLQILDIGGGKGALAHYLGQALENVQIHVVDIAEGAVQNGRKKAERLDTPVEFQVADASASFLENVEADVVVALHACGHLSDVALSHAIHKNAGFVIVPCCFNSNPNLTIPNAGSVPEWLGVPNEDWAALKLLAEVQGDIALASEAIEVICEIRAEAARKKLLAANPEMLRSIDIYKFPIEYSTRNTVLVGFCL